MIFFDEMYRIVIILLFSSCVQGFIERFSKTSQPQIKEAQVRQGFQSIQTSRKSSSRLKTVIGYYIYLNNLKLSSSYPANNVVPPVRGVWEVAAVHRVSSYKVEDDHH